MRRIFTVLALAVLFSPPGNATMVRKLNFEQLLTQSELVVHGRVISTRSYIMPSRGWVMTDARIQVFDSVKGKSGAFIIVTELGGVVGNTGMVVPCTAQFREDEEVLVFLKNLGGWWRTVGLFQGKFPVVLEHGERFVIPAVTRGEAEGKLTLKSMVKRIRQVSGSLPKGFR